MADLKLVGAVAIKVRPDARGFRGDTERQVKKQLAGVEAKVKVKVTADTDEAETDVDRAKKAIEKKGMTLKVGLDHDSVRRAQQQLDSALKGLADEIIKVTFDDEGIAKAQKRLDELAADAQVEMTFVPDEKGFQAVLDKIAAIRREKIEKPITFETDDATLDALERDMKERLEAAVGKTTVKVSYTNDRASLQRAIAAVNTELDKIKAVSVDVNLDETALTRERARLERVLAVQPVELKVNYDDQDSLKATRQRLRELLSEVKAKTFTVDVDEESIRRELRRIDDMIDDEVADKKKVELPVHTTGLQLVARELQFASRARRVPFHVVVDQKSILIAEGILRSLAGVNTLQAAGRGLENLITKFDTIALKGASWATAIGGIADALVYMTTAAFSIGDGMFEVVGLLAAAPAAFAAIAATAIVTTMAFDNMQKAFNGNKKALEALPPAAREAVAVLDDTWQAIQRPVQQAFWEKAGDSLREFVDKVIPQFKDGLTAAARGAGLAFDNVIKGFNRIAISGDLKKMFDNLELLFENVGHAAAPLVDAFNTLGLRGSEFLPRFGRWILDISTRFRDWINESSRLGNINAWIEDGVQSLKDMWRAGGAIIDQFKAIARASGALGNNGLDDFRRNMEHLAAVMLAEPFQSKMSTIFFGARQGATQLNKGVRDLGKAFGDAAPWVGNLLTLLGKLGGETLTGVSKTIGNLNFQSGLTASLRGMSDMVRSMTPAFDRLGSLIGNVGKISADVFRGLGPVFNNLLGILDDSVAKITDNLSKFTPTLLTLTNNLLGFARGPLTLVVDALNIFLGAVNSLPGPLKDATVAFVTFLLLRNQFGAFAGSLGKLWGNITTSSVKGSATAVTATGNLGTAVQGVNKNLVIMADGSVRQMNRFGTIVQGGMARARSSINSFSSNSIVSKLSGTVSGVAGMVGRLNGALALIGGVPGLVLGAIGVALSVIGGNAADASANVDRLRGSFDKVTGSATADTMATIAEKVTEIDKASDVWANFWRGVILQSKAGNETLQTLGLNVGEVAKKIAGSRGDYEAFVGSLKSLGSVNNLNDVVEFMKSGTLPGFPTFKNGPLAGQTVSAFAQQQLDSIKRAASAAQGLNISPDLLKNINTQDIENLTSKVEEQRKAFEIAQLGQAIYAQSLGTTVEKSKEVAAIMETIGDRSLDAAGKIDAINRSLELLNGGGLSEQAAKITRLDNLDAAVENAKAIAASIKASKDAIFNSNGLINEQSKAGRDLYKILAEGADNVKIQAQAAYDTAIKNGETAAQAAAKATAVVKSGDADLKAIADGAGLTVGQLKAQWSEFFGPEWVLTATFSANQDKFLAAKAEAEAAGIAFDGKEFMAWLLANPDPATVTTDQVRQHIREYAQEKYEAVLKALPTPALQSIAQAVGRGDAFARKDYTAILDGINNTSPAVQSAIASISRLTNPTWQARLSAMLNMGSVVAVEYELIKLSRTRTAVVNVTYSDVGRDVAMANRVRNGSAIGSIQDMFGRGLAGFNPKYFANGGIEQHIAQVIKGGPMRIWNEPETGGEAYIPLSAAKRPRSLAILSEVARQFGFTLMKAQQFGNGGSVGRTSPTTNNSASVHIGTLVTTDADEAVRKIRTSQQDALAVAGITMNGA